MNTQLKILCVLLLSCCASAFALDEFYSIDRSIRAAGMGGAFYGLSDDEYALFYNPAGLALYRGKPKLMFAFGAGASTESFAEIGSVINIAQQGNSISSVVNTLANYAGEPAYANVEAMPIFYLQKGFAIGLLLADTKLQAGLLGRDFDTSLDLTAISDSGIVAGYARDLTENLHVGVNLKGIFRVGGYQSYSILQIAQQSQIANSLSDLGGGGFGIDADLGAIYDVQNLPFGLVNQVGLTITNLFASDFSMIRIAGGGAPPGLDREISLGFHSVFPGVGIIDNFHVLLDFAEFGIGGESDPDLGAREGSFFKHVNFGCEAPINGWFVVRAGFHQGSPTAGLGIRTSVFDLDLATYGEELFLGINRLDSRRVAMRFAIGLGAPPPPPIYPKPSPELGPQDSQDPRLMRTNPSGKASPESLDDELNGPGPEPKPVTIQPKPEPPAQTPANP